MFAFGTDDLGGTGCHNVQNADGCLCLCETDATDQGSCTTQNNTNYHLYRYSNAGKYVTYYLGEYNFPSIE